MCLFIYVCTHTQHVCVAAHIYIRIYICLHACIFLSNHLSICTYVPSPARAAATMSAVAAATEGVSSVIDVEGPEEELTASLESDTSIYSLELRFDWDWDWDIDSFDVDKGGGGRNDEKAVSVPIPVPDPDGGASNNSCADPSDPLERGGPGIWKEEAVVGGAAAAGGGGVVAEAGAGGNECCVFDRTYSSAAAAICAESNPKWERSSPLALSSKQITFIKLHT